MSKADAKPRLIRCVLLLQQFDVEVWDQRWAENLSADHQSRLESPELGVRQEQETIDSFPEEHLYCVQDLGELEPPWFANFTNYLAGRVLPKGLSYQQKNFFFDLKDFIWEDPYYFFFEFVQIRLSDAMSQLQKDGGSQSITKLLCQVKLMRLIILMFR